MELTILGNFGLYPCGDNSNSGYLLQKDGCNVAFEMGSGVFSRLLSKFPPEKLNALILSHLHFDHISDLGVLNYYLESLSRKGMLEKKLRVILPECQSPVLDAIKSMGYLDLDFITDGDERTIGDVRLEFFKVDHPVVCLGFVAESEGKRFVYSGDTDLCSSFEEKVKTANLVLADGAFLSEQYKQGLPHMSAKICSDLSKKYGVRFLVTHILPSNNVQDMVIEIGGNPLCSIAKEGETYTL